MYLSILIHISIMVCISIKVYISLSWYISLYHGIYLSIHIEFLIYTGVTHKMLPFYMHRPYRGDRLC